MSKFGIVGIFMFTFMEIIHICDWGGFLQQVTPKVIPSQSSFYTNMYCSLLNNVINLFASWNSISFKLVPQPFVSTLQPDCFKPMKVKMHMNQYCKSDMKLGGFLMRNDSNPAVNSQ